MYDEAKKLLERIEWSAQDVIKRLPACPVCFQIEEQGHRPECELYKALALLSKPEAGEFQRMVGLWADRVMTESTNASICKHLQKEAKELTASYEPEEAADCFLILLHFAHRNKFDLLVKGKEKHEVNKRRKWGKPDKEGVVEHIEQQPEAGKCGMEEACKARWSHAKGSWEILLEEYVCGATEEEAKSLAEYKLRLYNIAEGQQAEIDRLKGEINGLREALKNKQPGEYLEIKPAETKISELESLIADQTGRLEGLRNTMVSCPFCCKGFTVKRGMGSR
jgi:hypothetical protein